MTLLYVVILFIYKVEKEKERENFRQLLGFKENEVYETKEYSVVKRINKIFKRQKITEKYRVEKYFIDIFFPVHNLAIEIDENDHLDRPEIKEQEREDTKKKKKKKKCWD